MIAERRRVQERRRLNLTGRRATDRGTVVRQADEHGVPARRELDRLRAVIQVLNLTGRRATDRGTAAPQPDEYSLATRREVDRLRTVIQVLVDAVQAMTASRSKPE